MPLKTSSTRESQMSTKNLFYLCLAFFTAGIHAAAPKAAKKAAPAITAPASVEAAPAPAPTETTESAKLPTVHLEAIAGAGYRLVGEQIELAKSTLSPTPDYYVNFFYGAKLSVFPTRLGFQSSYQRHTFRAASYKAGGGFSVYNYDVIDGGLAYAFPLDSSGSGKSFLYFGAGINYAMLTYADEFKTGLQKSAALAGYVLTFPSDAATGVGGYAQGGVMFFLTDNLFLAGSAKITYINTRFNGATKALDSWGIEVPLSVGLAF